MGRTGRKLTGRLPGGVPQEAPRAVDRVGGDPGPVRPPKSDARTGPSSEMDVFVGVGQNLLAAAGGAQDETRAAGAAHAERVPSTIGSSE